MFGTQAPEFSRVILWTITSDYWPKETAVLWERLCLWHLCCLLRKLFVFRRCKGRFILMGKAFKVSMVGSVSIRSGQELQQERQQQRACVVAERFGYSSGTQRPERYGAVLCAEQLR